MAFEVSFERGSWKMVQLGIHCIGIALVVCSRHKMVVLQLISLSILLSRRQLLLRSLPG